MSKKKVFIKWSLIVFSCLIVLIVAFGFWFISLVPPLEIPRKDMARTLPQDLPYLAGRLSPSRGKLLAIVTSCDAMGYKNKKTGYELTELSRAYYVFQANGFEVDIVSPKGGKPPVIIDDGDMGVYDYAFLNDPKAQRKVNNSIAMKHVDPKEYQGVYFVGGKGAMFDFPNDTHIQSLVLEHYQSGKVIGAVCHGPAALVNVTLDDGSPLLAKKKISSFTNHEELFLIRNASDIFPFLLQDKIKEQGADFDEGYMYLENVAWDGNLITGQNPWSTWGLAETMVRQLGYEPVSREKTAEENAVDVLNRYEAKGFTSAKRATTEQFLKQNKPIDREVLAVHSIVAAIQWKFGKSADLIRLLVYLKSLD
ncbi:type 1 glutamine amidotransferase domain-containing protein [Fulvivirga sp. M361]|uniref:type 1 glutamine amidotransferase domain-containing protein n=1 Tax=Fulvivirga sp. M361 TaxID=2594266 RepID=UPI00117A47C6|nr:type 1 glutamine amidotransferase domain-containing protein [Fulvivirga sp. M361]TRX47273.1 type 1 glutamine amidotransferase domain-containing protein [Fulvivirga sp. M361]